MISEFGTQYGGAIWSVTQLDTILVGLAPTTAIVSETYASPSSRRRAALCVPINTVLDWIKQISTITTYYSMYIY